MALKEYSVRRPSDNAEFTFRLDDKGVKQYATAGWTVAEVEKPKARADKPATR